MTFFFSPTFTICKNNNIFFKLRTLDIRTLIMCGVWFLHWYPVITSDISFKGLNNCKDFTKHCRTAPVFESLKSARNRGPQPSSSNWGTSRSGSLKIYKAQRHWRSGEFANEGKLSLVSATLWYRSSCTINKHYYNTFGLKWVGILLGFLFSRSMRWGH